MFGRKQREVLVPKRGKAPAKRRWQQELADDDSNEQEVTAEELEQWRKKQQRDEQQPHGEKEGSKDKDRRGQGGDDKAANGASGSRGGEEKRASSDAEEVSGRSPDSSPQGDNDADGSKKKSKTFAWMDSDDEDAEGDDGEEDDQAEEKQERDPTLSTADGARSSCEATATVAEVGYDSSQRPSPDAPPSAAADSTELPKPAIAASVLQVAAASGAFGAAPAQAAPPVQSTSIRPPPPPPVAVVAPPAPAAAMISPQIAAPMGGVYGRGLAPNSAALVRPPAAAVMPQQQPQVLDTSSLPAVFRQALLAAAAAQQAAPAAVAQQQRPFAQTSQFMQQQTAAGWSRPAAPVSASFHGFENEWLTGRIKRYVDLPGGGGYGFIDCEDAKLRFSRDVYIHKNQMSGLAIGDQVRFQIIRNNKGEPQARNVMRSDDALLLRANAQQAAQQQMQVAGDAWNSSVTGAAQNLACWPNVGHAMQSAGAGGGVAGIAPADGGSLMDEEQARQFQAALRGQSRP